MLYRNLAVRTNHRGCQVGLDGYTTIRFDRNHITTDKSIGGGLCMIVNKKWATNFCV